MSYEGHEQCICALGHYYERDAYDEDGICPDCKCSAAWVNSIDDTNCECYGVIPYDILKKHYLISAAVNETCNLGHVHQKSQDVFRIPGDETKQYRCYNLGDGYIPLIQYGTLC